MTNLQSTTLSQLPSDVWGLIVAPVSKNTVSTMPIEDAKKFVIESYLIYSKRAAEIAEKDYKKAYNDWEECKKTLNAHIKKMQQDMFSSRGLLSPSHRVQHKILQERLSKFNEIKLHCYKSYKESNKNVNPFNQLQLLAAAYGREHKIKKPFEIAAWQHVWKAEGTIKDLQRSLKLTEEDLNQSLIYLQDNIKQLEHKNECLAFASITITQLKAKNEQLKKQISENNKSKKLVLITAKPNSEKSTKRS